MSSSARESSQSMFGGGSGLSVEEALAALGFTDAAELAEWAQSATTQEIGNVGAALAVLIGGGS